MSSAGLKNLGNTCYLNSIIQCLRHCRPLTKDILEAFVRINKNDNRIMIFIQYQILLSLFKKKNIRSITPSMFVSTLHAYFQKKQNYGLLSVHDQNDAHEFLIFLLDVIHQVLRKKVKISISGSIKNGYDKNIKLSMENYKKFYSSDYSIIVKYFSGQYQSIVHKINENSISPTFDPYNCIELSIPGNQNNISLYDCLFHFINPEKIGNNIYKSIHFWNLPSFLIIVLKRFDCNGKKNNSNIKIPSLLNLHQYCKGPSQSNCIYSLISVCNHIGSMNSGHYFSYCKKNRDWYEYNDLLVRKIPENKVSTPFAYCLFYEKQP